MMSVPAAWLGSALEQTECKIHTEKQQVKLGLEKQLRNNKKVSKFAA